MPILPTDLNTETLAFLLSSREFTTAQERKDALTAILANQPVFGRINMDGDADAFCKRLAALLPHEDLCAVLRGLNLGSNRQQQAEALCGRIIALLPPPQAPGADPLAAHWQKLVADLSQPRYEIDQRFVRLTLLIDQGRDAQGPRFTEDAREFNDLRVLLAEVSDPAIVLLGAPGSGKTTLLLRLQLDDAQEALTPNPSPVALRDGRGERSLTFFVALNRYPIDETNPLAWLSGEWRTANPDLPDFETLLAQGRLILLLDALNEMRHRTGAHLAERIEQWRDFLPACVASRNRVVFTCRSLDYGISLSSPALSVRQANVKPMTREQMREFLQKYLAERAEAAWEALQKDPHQLELFSAPFLLKLLCEQAQADGTLPQDRAALFTGFVRRALRREMDAQNPLLQLVELLTERDRLQINTNQWASPHQLPERGALLTKLSHLAEQMQRSGLRNEGSQVRAKEQESQALLAHPHARRMLDAGVQLNILDEDLPNDEVLFIHQLVQEFFAARQFARQPDMALLRTEWRADAIQPSLSETLAALADSDPLPPAPATGWEETAQLAAAMSVPLSRVTGEGQGEGFVRALAEANLPLAAQCAAAPGVRVSTELKKELQHALVARTQEPAADLRARIAAGLALGKLGDPRFARHSGPHGDYLLPPLIAVAAGEYEIGADDGDYANQKPAHRVEIAAFEMGQFPVTNAEFGLFMQAGGYEDLRWWTTEADKAWQRGEGAVEGQRQSWRDTRNTLKSSWTDDKLRDAMKQNKLTSKQADDYITIRNWSDAEFENWLAEILPEGEIYRQPRFWDDPIYNNPNQPVVGICWHEVRAYCAWLSAQTKRAFRLPSEAEREAATRGVRGRKFAYGEKFDAAVCNTFESHIRRTTPIGVFLGGETPEGFVDLCGNVYDWTSSAYLDYPYRADSAHEDASTAEVQRVLRGGSWGHSRTLARAVSRGGFHPGFRDFDCGFRLVAAPVP